MQPFGVAFAVSLICATAAHAEIPLSVVDPAQPAFPTAEAAAIAALSQSAQLSLTVEYAGAIYSLNGAYHFTVPVTTGSTRDVEGYRIAISHRARLVALYHTHPRDLTNDQSEYFSSADIETAKQMHVASFVGVLKSRTVVEWEPGDSTVQLLDSAHMGGDALALGHPVGPFSLRSGDHD
jgi:hypothetical protein